MADDTLQDVGSVPESGRARRPPPTIDLEATSVSTEGPKERVKEGRNAETSASAESEAASASPESAPEISSRNSAPVSRPISPWVIAPFSGAVAAALVIAVGWMLGWPQVAPTPAAPTVNAATVDALAARVAGLEAQAGKPVSDPAVAARLDGEAKSIAALRGDLSNLRAQYQKLAAAPGGSGSAPAISPVAAADLAAINERLAKVEDASRTQAGELAQQDAKIAKAGPADDLALRRVVAAALLDVAVRHGDPYAAALSTAKSLSANADALKPLDAFAATGVPSPFALCRELLTLVPKLTPAAPDAGGAGKGIVDRLQAGAAKLVHIERTEATTGNDRAAIVGRVTAAALHNELALATRELETLAPADRAPAQAWLDKVKARDAALVASRQFADDTMAALASRF